MTYLYIHFACAIVALLMINYVNNVSGCPRTGLGRYGVAVAFSAITGPFALAVAIVGSLMFGCLGFKILPR